MEAELRSMAVGKGEMDKGVGGRVVATLESFLKETGKAGKYKVVTSARDARSNGFYKKAGFSFVKVFKHHNDLNEYHKSL